MIIKTVKTPKITPRSTTLEALVEQAIDHLGEGSILAVSSKVAALCEGRVAPLDGLSKNELVRQEAEYYLPPSVSRYGMSLSIARNILIPSAGVDESNAAGHFVLWPADPQQTANHLRQYLAQRYSLKKVGVLITDNTTPPLRRGPVGIPLAHSGFEALKNYIGQQDLFGRRFEFEQSGIAGGLAAAAVVVMGEGSEQTPLAVIEDLPFVKFQPRDPTKHELQELSISIEEDLYGPILSAAKWRRGRSVNGAKPA